MSSIVTGPSPLDAKSDRNLYKYEPLPLSSSFRILELLPGHGDDISYRLHLADWNSPPLFEAISYAWGDPKAKVPTICDDHVLEVTTNLRDGLLAMRHKDHSRFLWADAVCIDQTNDEERGHQVSNMRQLYQNAAKVLVWLGQDDDQQAEVAIAAMHEIASACCEPLMLPVAKLKQIDTLNDVVLNHAMRALKSDNLKSWSSVAWFFSRPWFSRLWVFQEVVSGPEVEILCGTRIIDWDIVALTGTYIQSMPNLRRSWRFHESFYDNAYFMRDRRLHMHFSLTDLLDWGRNFIASDPLDRIYALLGMPQFAKLDPPCMADYSVSKSELYQDVARRCIFEQKDLNILSAVQHIDAIDENFPSWIPQWDQERQQTPIEISSRFRWKAGGDHPVTVEAGTDLSVLKVTGVVFDVVCSTKKVDIWTWFDSTERVMQNHPILEFWLSQNLQTTRYPTGETKLDAYSMTLITGMNFYKYMAVDNLAAFRADFAAYIIRLLELSGQDARQYPELRSQSPSEDWSRYESLAHAQCWNRSLFSTGKGYMGLGPSVLEAGDIACVLVGATVPFILRPKLNYYQLVGDAYVHGIMEGEVIQQHDAGDLEKKVFEIH